MVYISLQTKPGNHGKSRLSTVIADSGKELREFLATVGVGSEKILSAGTNRERVELAQLYVKKAERFLSFDPIRIQFGVDQRDIWLKIHEREGTYQ